MVSVKKAVRKVKEDVNGREGEENQQEIRETVQIPGLEIGVIKFNLIGDSPLIMNKWSEKAIKAMEEKQQQKAQKGRQKREPQKEYLASMYKYPTGGHGFPAVAFKSAAVRAAKSVGMPMTDARAAFHVVGDLEEQLVKIKGKPEMRKDMVTLKGGGSTDIRYRAQFKEWSAELIVRYNRRVISPEQIINLFNVAGFGTGVGEWRPERSGQYGAFHVDAESLS